jgi:microcin C transport system permease protein
VWSLIVEKLPVSVSLGLWSFLLTYAVSHPAGHRQGRSAWLALRSLAPAPRSWWAIRSRASCWACCCWCCSAAASFLQLFPLRGLTGDDWEQLSLIGKVADYLWHLAMPLTCMVVGSFAGDHDAHQEHRARGDPQAVRDRSPAPRAWTRRRVLYRHVFRNALIPIVTGFPGRLHRRVLHRLAAGRDAVLARRPGPAVL